MIDIDVRPVAAAIATVGAPAILRRVFAGGRTDVAVRAVIRGYKPQELIGGIVQGDKEAIISDAEIAAAAWPGPPRRGDQIITTASSGVAATGTVQGVETRNVGNSTAMHVMQTRGS
jgi:hypothetical protein